MSGTFDPTKHRFAPEAGYFEDLKVGQRFYIPSRTQTEALFGAFQLVSGDIHPIHYDREYCRRHGHADMLAHGLQVFSQTAAGAGLFPHILGEALVGLIEVSAKFVNPVFCGDTLYPELVITMLEPQRTTGIVTLAATIHNQEGKLVLEGMHKYLVRKRPS